MKRKMNSNEKSWICVIFAVFVLIATQVLTIPIFLRNVLLFVITFFLIGAIFYAVKEKFEILIENFKSLRNRFRR